MIGYVTLGADDMAAAARFYGAILPALGFAFEAVHGELSYSWPGPGALPDLYIKRPFDGQPAAQGNGTMVAFSVPTQAAVRELHAAGLAAGGRDEGAPGFRADYGPHFYVSYLRDPQGNKLALYCDSPDEPGQAN